MTSKVDLVSVVIPTLNEAGNIREILNTIQNDVAYPKEIIVVDSNSTDGTKEIVKDTSFCRLIIEPRRGYGVALRTGMKNARGNIIVMVDGDGTYQFRASAVPPGHSPPADAGARDRSGRCRF